jgi:catalase (peroxidase I)
VSVSTLSLTTKSIIADSRSLDLGPAPENATLEMQDLGWANSIGTGNADDAVTSGLEVIWSKTPTKWSNGNNIISVSFVSAEHAD